MQRFDEVVFDVDGDEHRGYFDRTEGGYVFVYDCNLGCTIERPVGVLQLKYAQGPGGVDVAGYGDDPGWRL